MGLLSRFAKAKYKDEEIVVRAETAIAEDTLTTNGMAIRVSSKNGIVTLSGKVATEREKNHIEGIVRSSLRQAGLKFEIIENQLSTNR